MTASNSQIIRTILIIFIVLLLCPVTYGSVIYVDDDATGDNIGTNWLDAVNSLQDALLLSYFYEKPLEIRVAGGIYTPDVGLGVTPGDRKASFELINGVTIKGGYAGLSEGFSDTRDIVLYETILSGDLEQDDGPDYSNGSENSYHVVTCNNTDQSAVLDGVTITAGGYNYIVNSIEAFDRGGGMYNFYSNPMLINCTFKANRGLRGAGMYNSYSNPSLIDCTFLENSADECGGGIYNTFSDPILLNCTFIRNAANNESGGVANGEGGGIYNYVSCPILLNCTFTENTVDYEGGGICNIYNSEPVITNCTFNENSAEKGGGIYNSYSTVMLADCHFSGNSTEYCGGAVYNTAYGISTFHDCTFKENSAAYYGGAIFNSDSLVGRISMKNCIFVRNSAEYGGAIGGEKAVIQEAIISSITDYNSGALYLENCTLSANVARQGGGAISSDIPYLYTIDEDTGMRNGAKLVNCILWGNTPDEIMQYESGQDMCESVEVFYSDVQGGFPGQGNIDVDPIFVDPNNDDYHLKSQTGRWDSTEQCWVMDQVNSPCIDAGDPNTSVDSERSPNGDIVNMGAYGGTLEASLSPRPPLPDKASNPSHYESSDIVLYWMAGKNAVHHDVYIGSDEDAVTAADTSDTTGIYRGRQTATSYTILEEDKYIGTYYWRIDEIDGMCEVVTGDIWSFSNSPAKGRACFISETGVWSDGKLVPISKVAQGRSINVIDCIKTIEQVQEHQGTFTLYDVLLDSGKTITVAENHYFMAESGRWVSLQDLIAEKILPCFKTRLKTSKGTVGITSITRRPIPYTGKVYNLKIHGSDKYLIGEDAIIVRDY